MSTTSNKYSELVKFAACLIITTLAGCTHIISNEEIPRKVILFIGDGMDDQQITIARNYFAGAEGDFTLDLLPHRSTVGVLTIDEVNPERPIYVADSANSATAMATGKVTSRGRIATSAKTDQDLVSIIEIAEKAGLNTGVVTTASVTDATPAAFISHVNQRGCQGPDNMNGEKGLAGFQSNCPDDLKANGGKGSIAEQIVASGIDVVLGGGMMYFQQTEESPGSKNTVLDRAKENGFQVISTKQELNRSVNHGRLLGIFSDSTMPIQMIGAGGGKAQLVEKNTAGKMQLPTPFTCINNPLAAAAPRLVDMTEIALSTLEGEGQKGFFLMVESASIDKESHKRNPCGSIGEVKQLNEAIVAALTYAKTHPETLILVTADHGQAAQLIPEQSMLSTFFPSVASPGYMARIETREGGIMGVNYATNDSKLMEDHTGVQVPLFASGNGSETIPSYIKQTDIFRIVINHLGLTR